jgi:NADPH:quinone reductase-like Zn-dependent oxidoreductase
VVRQLGLGRLRPIVDAVYPLARAREAYERLEHGAQIGKVTVSLTE